MRTSQKIFIDSSIFISFIDRVNLNHSRSVALLEYLGNNEYQAYTSILTVMQTFSRLERDVSPAIATEFLQSILESDIQILYPTKSELVASFRYMRSNPVRQVSLTDIVNASMMEKGGISAILTFDFWHSIMGINVSTLIK